MELFALISTQNNEYRYINSHPFLKHLPMSWARGIMSKMKPRFTEILHNNDNYKELGYILDIPEFFVEPDNPSTKRGKIIKGIVQELGKKDIRTLVFPSWWRFISREEEGYLAREAITILDGSLIRLVSLKTVIEKLFTVLKIKPNEIEIGIWGANSSLGRFWIDFLAPSLNYLSIGDGDVGTLKKTGDEIFYKTGLSCHISADPNKCLKNKDVIVLCSNPQNWNKLEGIKAIISLCESPDTNLNFVNTNPSTIIIDSGWPIVPGHMEIKNELGVWERLGVLEASLFLEDSNYRNIVTNYPLNLENIKLIEKIISDKGIKFPGMLSKDRILSYDGIRKLYFGNILDK